jgi:hypothetical protein
VPAARRGGSRADLKIAARAWENRELYPENDRRVSPDVVDQAADHLLKLAATEN